MTDTPIPAPTSSPAKDSGGGASSPSTRRAKPINSRNKGSGFERDIAIELELLTGVRFKRDLEQYRASDHGDLIPSDPDFPYLIECKRYASGHGCKPAWKDQAAKAAKSEGKLPCVIFRFDRQPVRVCLPFTALGHDLPGEWFECTLDGLAYLAREAMAVTR